MKNFDYEQKVKKVEKLISMVEDPLTGIGKAQELTGKANGLLDECAAWLRCEKENIND